MAIRLDSIERGDTLTEQVCQKLREALVAGVFPPGERLTIRSVAASLGVSLTPAREALNILAAEGALETAPNRTMIVAPLSIERLREIAEIRVALETVAAEAAATRLTDKEIARAVAANDALIRATEAKDFKQAVRHNHAFHFTIYGGARMPTLLKMIEGLWLRTGAYVNLIYPAFGLARKGIENHNRAAAAVVARDGAALARCIETDIRLSSESLETELKTKVQAA
jgi:DNA-binding GntR family transcriptional regulator